MTRTKLYSELFNRYNRERRQFFLDCREESGRQNLRMLKKSRFYWCHLFCLHYSLRHFWFVDGLFRYRIMYCLDLLF